MHRFAIAAVLAVSSMGVFAGAAAADPVATVCGSVSITVNGSSLVDQSQCQVLPPA